MRRRISFWIALCLPLAGWITATSFAADPTTAPSGITPGTALSDTPCANQPGVDWIDPATGHRIIRLSTAPGSLSLYFHQFAYTTEGDLVVIYSPNAADPTKAGLYSVNLRTRKIELIAPGVSYSRGMSSGIEVGRKTRTVYYERRENGQTSIYATQLDTKATRKVADLGFNADFGGVNADETLMFGDYNVGGGGGRGRGAAAPGALPATQAGAGAVPSLPTTIPTTNPAAARGAARAGRGGGGGGSKQFFTVNIKTGQVKTFFPSNDNLNHTQCSPTDPMLALYCHEGNWASLDRIWTIHLDGTNNKLMHQRTMPNEIAGHEFFTPDGQMVMYDLQTPESGQFWLAGVNVYTGQRIRYPLERVQWSVHYNASHNGKLYAGDGGGPNSVADRLPGSNQHLNPPGNGQWMYLFTPKNVPMQTMKVNGEDVQVGAFDVEKLVDLSKHYYTLEPNLSFTPDDKWIVFRSNISGDSQVYAVEVAKHAAP